MSGGAEARAADMVLPDAERVLCVGIGGGGDVVGALAAAQLLERETVLGGLSWERLPVDPVPGPRRIDELLDATPLAAAAALAGPTTRTSSGVLFAESRIAAHLGTDTVLIDPNPGPAVIADGLAAAADHFGCDGILLVDVGGDVLAHGDEPTLASPLADAALLAAGALLVRRGRPVALCVVGAGCDGELTPAEVRARIDEAASHGGLLAELPLSPPGSTSSRLPSPTCRPKRARSRSAARAGSEAPCRSATGGARSSAPRSADGRSSSTSRRASPAPPGSRSSCSTPRISKPQTGAWPSAESPPSWPGSGRSRPADRPATGSRPVDGRGISPRRW